MLLFYLHSGEDLAAICQIFYRPSTFRLTGDEFLINHATTELSLNTHLKLTFLVELSFKWGFKKCGL